MAAEQPRGLLREGLLLATGATLGVGLSLCLRRPAPAAATATATSGGDDGRPQQQQQGQLQDRKPYIAVLRDGTAQARADAALSAAYDRVRNGVSPRPDLPLSPCAQASDPQGGGAICAQDGTMDNVMSIHSLNPATLDAHAALYMQCMKGDSPLSRAEREIVAVAASRCNRCRYCARQRLSVAV